jgi:molecular chaperone GrpE
MSDRTPKPSNTNEDGLSPEGKAAAAPDPDSATVTGLDPLAEAQRQRDDYLDQLQRSRAEFANYQKRSKAQAVADQAYAVGSFARDVIEVLDNLERAIEAVRGSAVPGVAEGLDMALRQGMATLAKHGVEPIEALGQPFDPNLHEAVIQQPDREHPEGTVVAELSKGYRLRDRVLRPTKVAVSVAPAQSQPVERNS